MLVDADILEYISRGEIDISPYCSDNLQPASYDLHLGNKILIPQWHEVGGYFDPSTDEEPLKEITLPNKNNPIVFRIPPGGVALGCTVEAVRLRAYAPLTADIAGCSSLGRWFLFVHVTAGFIDPGWDGNLTLELYNASPWNIRIWAGMRIAQVRFYYTRSKPLETYGNKGHYYGDTSATPGRYHE